jgi:dipeptidyl aminopeptidase/acylaminoacyl peptidase
VPSPLTTAATVLLSAGLIAACDGGTTQPPPLDLDVAVSGPLERGSVVHLSVTRSGTAVPQAEWQLTLSPTDAAVVLGGDSLRLVRSGSVTFTVDAGGDRGIDNVEVARPPVIYFDRVVEGNRDIYRIDLDGQNLARLTTDPSTDQDPTAGGGKVVFVSYRAGTADIWSVGVNGGAATALTNAPKNETTPSISPDGQRLAYAYDGDLVSKLWTAQGDGSNPARATEGFGFNGSIESSPAWAPSGNRLAFMSTAAGSADIYDFNIGAAPTSVGSSNAADVEPAWSPDGQSLALVSTRESNNTDIYVVRLSTGAVTRLTTGAQTEGQPAWAPDSRRLVYTDFSSGTRKLRWMDVTNPGVSYPIETGDGRAENATVTAP